MNSTHPALSKAATVAEIAAAGKFAKIHPQLHQIQQTAVLLQQCSPQQEEHYWMTRHFLMCEHANGIKFRSWLWRDNGGCVNADTRKLCSTRNMLARSVQCSSRQRI